MSSHIAILAFLLLSPSSTPVAGDFLKLVLTADKYECVLREPVCLRAELRNVSRDTVRVIQISRLASDMMLSLEIETPAGNHEARISSPWPGGPYGVNPGYRGEPLLSGDGILLFIYPSISSPVDGEEFTPEVFNQAGTYKVRVVYEVPSSREWLHENAPNHVVSNEINLTFREPDSLERSILEIYWGKRSEWVGQETLPKPYDDLKGLEASIAAYADHPLAPYLKLRLANVLSIGYMKRHADAVVILQELRARNSDFRMPETTILLADNLGRLDRDREAQLVLDEALRRNPALMSNYEFMCEYLSCRYRRNGAEDNPIRTWQENRLKGIPHPEKLEMKTDPDQLLRQEN